MKQNDWTSDMRSRLADNKAPVPDDLWDKIECRLNNEGIGLPIKESGKHAQLNLARLTIWASAAAAAIALMVVIGYHANEDTIEHLADNYKRATTNHNGDIKTAGMQANGIDQVLAQATMTGHRGLSDTHPDMYVQHGDNPDIARYASEEACDAASAEERTAAQDENTEVKDEAERTNAEAVRKAESEKRRDNRPAIVKKTPMQADTQNSLYAYTESSRQSADGSGKWSIGAHTGGTFSNNYSTAYPGMSVYKAALSEDINCPNVYMVTGNAALLAGYKEVKHHSQPITFGLSVGYDLTDRLTATTGLVYTHAESDFVKSSGKDNITETQQLHYIGVPIGIKYNIWSNSLVQAYTTAGAEADFNIAATMTTADVKTDTDKDKVQFSVNAAAGLQINIMRQVGVFAEPGIRYYFNNKSNVETIFKDKPWAFSMQIGVRANM